MRLPLLFAILALIPCLSFARIKNFDDLIDETEAQQDQLHGVMQKNVQEARQLTEQLEVRKRLVLKEEINVPHSATTKQDILTFAKEKKQSAKNDKKQFDRLANELDLSNQQ